MEEKYKSDRIFIVDDDELTANIYAKHLYNLGFQKIELFHNGQDCVNRLIEEPQLIFLDYQMDYLDGLEVLKKIKRFDPNIYVVFVSGQTDMETAIESLKYGAFDYIVKGKSDMERIEEVISRIYSIREQLNYRDPGIFRKFLSIIV